MALECSSSHFSCSSENHVAVSNNCFKIVLYYFKPNTPVEEICYTVSLILSPLNLKNDNVIVVGDFNRQIDRGERGELITEVLHEQFKLELRNERTHHTFVSPQCASTIDLLYSNIDPQGIEVKPAIERRHRKVISTWNMCLIRPDKSVQLKRERSSDAKPAIGERGTTYFSGCCIGWSYLAQQLHPSSHSDYYNKNSLWKTVVRSGVQREEERSHESP